MYKIDLALNNQQWPQNQTKSELSILRILQINNRKFCFDGEERKRKEKHMILVKHKKRTVMRKKERGEWGIIENAMYQRFLICCNATAEINA